MVKFYFRVLTSVWFNQEMSSYAHDSKRLQREICSFKWHKHAQILSAQAFSKRAANFMATVLVRNPNHLWNSCHKTERSSPPLAWSVSDRWIMICFVWEALSGVCSKIEGSISCRLEQKPPRTARLLNKPLGQRSTALYPQLVSVHHALQHQP